jgi:ADP-dependent NAD(P)H-hydrate dehydratase
MNCRPIDADYLRANPPPDPDKSGDKHSRGRVLVVAGSVEVPGAALLAGLGALRAGAGVLQIATCKTNAPHLGMAMPEAMIIGCQETPGGEIDPSNAERLADLARDADAVLFGPGLIDEKAVAELRSDLMSRADRPIFILDASAFTSLRNDQEGARVHGRRMIVTPHAGEMASFLKKDKEAVEEDPLAAAQACAGLLEAVVVMKGGRTYFVPPTEPALCFERGPVALGTSGSGDVLAGVIAGMAARGASRIVAAAWAVYLHGEAGRQWVKRNGRLGLLAREIADEVPALMRDLEKPARIGR